MCRSRLEREQEIVRKHEGCAHAARVHSFVTQTFSRVAVQHGESYSAASPTQPISSKGRASLENTEYWPRQGPTTPMIERRQRQHAEGWHDQELQLKRHQCDSPMILCIPPTTHLHAVCFVSENCTL